MIKNNLQKGFVVPVLIGIIAVLVIGGGVYIYKNKKVEVPVVVDESEEVGLDNEQEVAPIDTTVKNTSMKSFKLGTLEFSYPGNLSLKQTSDSVNLSHSIPFKHVNSCDLKDGSSLNDATDFGVSFKLYNSDIKNSIKKDNPNGYMDIIKNGVVSIQTGFVDKYKIGGLDGYKITIGVEGCGYSTYYFSISEEETLVVRRDVYLQTLQIGREKLTNISGFITSSQEEQIFKDILSSVTGIENQKTMTIKLYFPNTIFNPEMMDCSLVYPVDRVIPYTVAVATATLNELLKGPTTEERQQGYVSSIPDGVKVNWVKMEGSTLLIDFNEVAMSGGGSCGQSAKGSSMFTTLRQFPTVKDIKMTVNGKGETADLFQP